MTKIERLEEIAGKGDLLSSKDKEFVTKLSAELGVPFTPRARCASCYADQAIILRKKLRDDAAANQPAPAYILKDGIDVFFGSIRVNKDTITDELAEAILARGFNRNWFARCGDN